MDLIEPPDNLVKIPAKTGQKKILSRREVFLLFLTSGILTFAAIFSAAKLYQTKEKSISPYAPEKAPALTEDQIASKCTLKFFIPSPTPTKTLTPVPPECWNKCLKDADCPNNLECINYHCANPNCPDKENCVCPSPTPTKTPTKTKTSIPTKTPSSTKTPTTTKTPTLVPPECWGECQTDDHCPLSLKCLSSRCANENCPNEENCICPSPTVTKTKTPTPTRTETPEPTGTPELTKISELSVTKTPYPTKTPRLTSTPKLIALPEAGITFPSQILIILGAMVMLGGILIII